ncbi:hypothetical protein AC579_4102 [Pseudocercospora musae]|uniref:Uncharacterized protein n=1 Tax=Pseudocercospora musae TaxID=113226 RepID=A0A139I3S1_9PEZI|nr:hypothetical protein AC579_4102 [Pseudocercospora musae]
MGGMGRHGMHNTPFSAGSYPHPQAPFPLGYTAAPMMPMSMGPHMMGDGGMDCFMSSYPSTPFGGSMCAGGMSSYPSWPMGGIGGFGGATTLLDGLDDMDDNGVWDGDGDVENFSGPFDLFYRANRRAKRRNKGCGMFNMSNMMPSMPMHAMGMGMGMGMGMPPIGCI